MKKIFLMILSSFVFVTNILVLMAFNLIIPFYLALVIRDVDMVLGGLTIILTFMVLYFFNKILFNLYVKEPFYTFTTLISAKRNV
ncbi:hypothetical protein [Staphylococcus aureus]|uniref:hypothetical protein n=1 Tax=Staphylococcus aureus TaxID=1280 RepID=UPI0039BDFB17